MVGVVEQPLEEADDEPLEEAAVDCEFEERSETTDDVEEKVAATMTVTKESTPTVEKYVESEEEVVIAATQEERELMQLFGIVKTEDERLEEVGVSMSASSSTRGRVSFGFRKSKAEPKVFGRPVFS